MPASTRLNLGQLDLGKLGFTRTRSHQAIPVHTLKVAEYDDQHAKRLNKEQCQWLTLTGFSPKPGRWCLLPPAHNPAVLLVVADEQDWRSWSDFAHQAPAGQYQHDALYAAALHGWSIGRYRFNAQNTPKPAPTALMFLPEAISDADCVPADVAYHVRHMIDCPANIMTTDELAAYALKLFSGKSAYRAPDTLQHWVGDALLQHNFPLIHVVGRASVHPPQMLDMQWLPPSGDAQAPLITIIGKGVCFDSGGLDLKPRAAMLTMKKDMGGAAHAIGTAALLLHQGVNARIRLILGIAENAVSANAFRPGDILLARNGKSIEVGDTDAEGRLILADCLCLAAEDTPAHIVDFATLTGAARVALGTDLPALFCNDPHWTTLLTQQADDPLWAMPLHAAYAAQMDGRISDYNSAPAEGLAGAITAALFLQNFVAHGCAWAHIDLMAYAPKPIHGRAVGAAAQGLFAVAKSLAQQYPQT